MDCVVKLPHNALTAKGLSTPWTVTGCDQTVNPTFAECVSVNPTTGAIGVYSPLLINDGSTNFITPTVPKLPANAVVGCWFGTNGATTTLAGATTQAKCTSPGVQLLQFAACNAPAFFAVADKKSTIPALGTGLNGKPCYTIRSFEIIDMDQSDNVVTSFLQDPNTNKLAQTTIANQKALPNATEITNGSDNLLLDAAYRPALGCTAFTAPNLADPTGPPVGALALNELQAKKYQGHPVALIPDFDPFVVTNNTADIHKQRIYRAAVNQPPPPTGAAATNEQLKYCEHMLNITAPGYITDLKFLSNKTSPAPANGKDLFTFLGQRFAASWAGLTCNTLIPLIGANGTAVSGPITANFDDNGVCISVTFNTPSLVKLLYKNGGPTGEALALSATPTTPTTTITTTTKTTATTTAAVATTTTQAVITTTTTASSTSSGSIVLTLAGENDGAGVTNIQCNQGVLFLQVVFQATINVDNIHAYQPMAELGLPTVSATFSINGAAPTLTQQNAFNVQSSSVSGATWTFLLQDDGPHPGGQFTLGACTAGTTPTVLLTLSSGLITDAQGLPNGADGGPAVPLVNGPVTVVNALPAEFNGGAINNGVTSGGTPVVATTTTTNAAVATTTTTIAAVTGAAVGTVTTTVNVNSNPNNANCGGPSNSNLLLYMGTTLSVKAAGIANTACTNGPMAECGLPTIQGSVFFVANNSAVEIIAWTGGNEQFSGNTFQITEEDDMPYYGGTLVLNLPCSYNPATFNSGIANQLGFSFVTLNSVVATIDNAGNNVNANVVVVVAGATATTGESGAAVATTTTTAAGAASTGSIVLTLAGENDGAGVTNIQCNQGVLFLQVVFQATINVDNIHAYQPMAELGLPTVSATFSINGAAPTLTQQNAFNVQSSSVSGATWTFLLQDDGPHPGGQFTLGACTAGTTPTVLLTLSSGSITDAQGLPNGADGGPAVPLVNGPVTVVNALPAEFNGGAINNGVTAGGTPVGTSTTTVAAVATTTITTTIVATVATTTTIAVTGGATGTVTTIVSVKANPNNANCGGPSNSNLLLYMGTTLSVKATGIANTACTNGPMAECGLPTIQGSVFFVANNSAVDIIAWTGGNEQFSGNTFQIAEEDDMPYYGGTLVLNLPCSYNPATFNSGIANQLGFSFVTLNDVVATIDNAGNNVNANVVVTSVA
ncbi:hypothetical protein HK100_011481 [Physocladia obscura]|uniref:Uncharacterized protein n=1 Tax=Physocladia obscura TaxID=109957 RepID=A0AAD5T3Q1_9FUNG|nr:hypothetical protein HK100_011481 [Physocladia obscura]